MSAPTYALSYFPSLTDPHPQALPLTWDQIVAVFGSPGAHRVAQNKNAVPLFSPCTFTGSRKAENADRISLLVLDYDHLPSEIRDRALIALVETGVAACVHTSYSHSALDSCLRVIVPLAYPVDAADWPRVWPVLNQYLGGYGDPACRDASRAYFVPACPLEREQSSWAITLAGTLLDPSKALPSDGNEPFKTVPLDADSLRSFQKRLQKKDPVLGEALGNVLVGAPWAAEGSRDTTLFRLLGEIVRAFPTASPEQISAYFDRSAACYPDFDRKAPLEKARRLHAEHHKEHAERVKTERGDRQTRIAIATRGARVEPYTQAELDAYCARENIAADVLAKRWILRTESSFYFLDPDSGYVGPFGVRTGTIAAHTHLAASPLPLKRFNEKTQSNVFREAADLALDYGQPVRRVVADLTAKKGSFDGTTLREAPCPMRDLPPQYDLQCDMFLRFALADLYDTFAQWMAWCTDLTRPLVAIYFDGPPSAGKSLIPLALSRFWTVYGPTTLEQALAQFNAALCACPLVFADEKTPTDFRGQSRTAEIRELIQSTVRPLRRKFVEDAEIHGCVRLVLSANNGSLFAGDETLTPNDLEAIVGRFFYVPVNPAACDFLRTINTWDLGWISRDVLPRHLAWVAASTQRISNPGRFVLQLSESAFTRRLATSSAGAGAVAHWLLSWLLAPEKLRLGKPPTSTAHLVRVHEGDIFVNVRAMADHWETYATNVPIERASVHRLGTAIRGMVGKTGAKDDRTRLTLPGWKVPPKFHRIDVGYLREWARTTGFCTDEEITSALEKTEAIDSAPFVTSAAFAGPALATVTPIGAAKK